MRRWHCHYIHAMNPGRVALILLSSPPPSLYSQCRRSLLKCVSGTKQLISAPPRPLTCSGRQSFRCLLQISQDFRSGYSASALCSSLLLSWYACTRCWTGRGALILLAASPTAQVMSGAPRRHLAFPSHQHLRQQSGRKRLGRRDARFQEATSFQPPQSPSNGFPTNVAAQRRAD